MTSTNIHISGLLRSTKTKGFTTQGAINELIDNSLDADATVVDIHFNTEGRELIIADDGLGMTKAMADSCYCIHNDKPASGAIGMFGIGKTIAEGLLSDLASSTTTVTKVESGRLLEVTADWVTSIATNTWNPRSGGASADVALPLWERAAIDREHGTVVHINMTPAMFNDIATDVETLCRSLAYVYQEYDPDTFAIRVWRDGEQYELDTSDTLGWNDVLPSQRNEVNLEAWVNSAGEELIFHSEGSEMVRFNRGATQPTIAARYRDYAEMPSKGYTLEARLSLRDVYNDEWNPPEDDDGNRPPYILGSLSFVRNRRHLKRVANEPPTSGTHERKRYLGAARHALYYDHHADRLMKTEGNKSNVTPENINKQLMWTVNALARKWADSYWKQVSGEGTHGIRPRTGEASAPTVKEFKRLYADPLFRASYDQIVRAHMAHPQ